MEHTRETDKPQKRQAWSKYKNCALGLKVHGSRDFCLICSPLTMDRMFVSPQMPMLSPNPKVMGFGSEAFRW